MNMRKVYLGDGVYVEWRDSDVVLTTEDGEGVTNRIVLAPDVFNALAAYVLDGEPRPRERADDAE